MNNQITIINNLNQEETVELISYFQNNNNNKKYLFYTKNEIVQDGLIKIHVAEDNAGLVSEISPEEWDAIKHIMQDIIKGTTNSNITYLPVQTNLKIGMDKVIAFNSQNKESIQNAYNADQKIIASNNAVSNKDLLSQSFGAPVTPTLEPTLPTLEPTAPILAPEEKVDLTGIPTNANLQDMETNPVNLSMEMPKIEPVPMPGNVVLGIDNPINEMPKVDGLVLEPLPVEPVEEKKEEVAVDVAPTITTEAPAEVKETPSSNETSPFQVSTATNIFDQQTPSFGVTENDLNAPLISEENIITPIAQGTEEKPLEKNNIPKQEIKKSDISDDIIEILKEIEKENANLFEQLAHNSKRKIELLQKQQKLTETESLDKTVQSDSASNLFGSDGSLIPNEIEEQKDNVLGLSLAA